jgi:hypothetical protein
MKRFASYIGKLLSNSPDASSKRIMALLVTMVIIAIAFINQFTGKTVPEYIFKGLVSLAAIGYGAISVENIGTFVQGIMKNKNGQ